MRCNCGYLAFSRRCARTRARERGVPLKSCARTAREREGVASNESPGPRRIQSGTAARCASSISNLRIRVRAHVLRMGTHGARECADGRPSRWYDVEVNDATRTATGER